MVHPGGPGLRPGVVRTVAVARTVLQPASAEAKRCAAEASVAWPHSSISVVGVNQRR